MKMDGKKLFKRFRFKRSTLRREGTITRTGYAFAHEEGFGRIIESGVGFRGMRQERVEEERRKRLEKMGSLSPSVSTTPTPVKKLLEPSAVFHETVTTETAETTPIEKVDITDTEETTIKHETDVDIHSTPQSTAKPEKEDLAVKEDLSVTEDVGAKEDMKEACESIPGTVPTGSPEPDIPLQEKSASYEGTNLWELGICKKKLRYFFTFFYFLIFLIFFIFWVCVCLARIFISLYRKSYEGPEETSSV